MTEPSNRSSTTCHNAASSDEEHQLGSNGSSAAEKRQQSRQNDLGVAQGSKRELKSGYSGSSSPRPHILKFPYPQQYPKSQEQIENITLIRREQEIRKAGREEDPGIPQLNDEQSLEEFQATMQDHQLVANYEVVNDFKRQKVARCCFWALVAAVLVTGSSVALGLLLGDKKRNGSSPVMPELSVFPTMSPSEDVSLECLLSSSADLTDQQKNLQTAIMDMHPELDSGMKTAGTPERASLCWLSDLDEFQIESNDEFEHVYELIQRFALGVIYYHFITFSDTNKLVDTNWLGTSKECMWDRIQCTDGQRVDLIDFDNLELRGSLPTTIALLTHLSEINFGRNQLSGALPSELWRITDLKNLSLGFNAFSGTMPTLLTKLTNLDALFVQENNFSGELPLFSDLVGLKEISIIDNRNIVGALSTIGLSGVGKYLVPKAINHKSARFTHVTCPYHNFRNLAFRARWYLLHPKCRQFDETL